ncbi:hypothetical protein [Promicromonospora sp. NPDC060271]|uniref:hypothetical protein n=1 Tax=Promicromonospora sp. NPDC060271 TaxID=3347089 RepID=UPI0036538AFF
MTPLVSGKPTDKWAFLLPPGWARVPAPGTGAVYVPTERMAGIAIPASITETEIFGVAGLSATEVAASLLGGAQGSDAQGSDAQGSDAQERDAQESTVVDVDGRPGARLASTLREAPAVAGGPAAGTRQVTYVVSRDDVEGDWLVLSFSTTFSTGPDSGPAEQLAQTLVDFFDAVMTTFRWTGPGAGPVDLPERTVPGSA